MGAETETTAIVTVADHEAWRRGIADRVRGGARFAGVYGRAEQVDGVRGCLVTALLVERGAVSAVETRVEPTDGRFGYPALTAAVPAAFWYERAVHDLSGIVPVGHPRLDPLLLVAGDDAVKPRPGNGEPLDTVVSAPTPPGPVDLRGQGVLAFPLGPVRSGVFESVEFLIETLGEDIPHVNIRPHYKHRGIAKRFEGLTVDDGVLVAERVEGIATIAHACAYAHAVESLVGATPPPAARLLRVVHAELERIANHLDVAMRLAEAAGLAVAVSRFGWHKEETLRLVDTLCGNRFGRGVVVPGGVAAGPRGDPVAVVRRLSVLHGRIRADLALAMKTSSFLDRLRTTGILTPERARVWAALGPVGRASGSADDCRWARPTDAYADLAKPATPRVHDSGDVLARARVRWGEIDDSVRLANEALSTLSAQTRPEFRVPIDLRDQDGFGIGWAEAPQGEVLYVLHTRGGLISRCFARSASFHNLAVFHEVFGGDVFTDFAFIEASFGLGYAGAAM